MFRRRKDNFRGNRYKECMGWSGAEGVGWGGGGGTSQAWLQTGDRQTEDRCKLPPENSNVHTHLPHTPYTHPLMTHTYTQTPILTLVGCLGRGCYRRRPESQI